MARYASKQEALGPLWLAEVARFEHNEDDIRTVDECAQLADELWHHAVMADEDPDFIEELVEWTDFIWKHELMLPLEQSCHDGVLLPTGQRAIRLESCPDSLLRPLRWFFELCPRHVKSYIARDFYLLVRMERARRTGIPEWRPRRRSLQKRSVRSSVPLS